MGQPCGRCGQMHEAGGGCSRASRSGHQSTIASEDEVLVGNILANRYKVGDVIGVGSTGTVFGVEHVTFARPAAMKVLRPRFADAEVVSRVFHGEARAAWSVSHPCLCEVFDIGTLPDASPFFVMERLEGESLAARISRERLSVAAALDLMMQLLAAIATVHGRDLLLRDLRPRNLFLAHRRGCRPLLKILDFGLARLTPLDRIRQDWERLRGNELPGQEGVGSTAIPFYLSPERSRGEHAVEPASDLFVAATIFYEALAGERPFAAKSWSGLLAQIAQGKPVPLHARRSDVSLELSAFVSRCLSASPRARPSSAKEMQDELRAVIEVMRKGSSSAGHASANMSVGPDAEPARERPPSGSYERARRSPMFEDDEIDTQREARTETKGGSFPGVVLPRLHAGELEDELSTAARRIDPEFFSAEPSSIDEASAENSDRTVPPPPLIDVEISFDENTDHDVRPELDGLSPLASATSTSDDEETETMRLSPELKARVDQLMATKPTPVPAVPRATAKPPRGR